MVETSALISGHVPEAPRWARNVPVVHWAVLVLWRLPRAASRNGQLI